MTAVAQRPAVDEDWTPPELFSVVEKPDGRRGFRLHFHEGQRRAWKSTKRIVAIIAGVRSGKTVFGPFWMFREICKKGPGDYLVAAPHFALMRKTVLPQFLRLFQRHLKLGKFGKGDNTFVFSEAAERQLFGRASDLGTRVMFGHASNPDSLASATVKAAWLDEAGQDDFKPDSWEEVKQRVAINRGRILITTTPYRATGWLREQVFDYYKKNPANPRVDVIQFKSTANPAYDPKELEYARATLPGWKYRMRHEGAFERPAGAIYDCYVADLHRVPWFAVPDNWPIYLGMDFGGANTCGVFLAEERGNNDRLTGRLFIFRVYGPAGSRSARDHVKHLCPERQRRPSVICGGAKAEGHWRIEFAQAGLGMQGPIVDEVEVQIDRVYGAIARNELYVMQYPAAHPWGEGLDKLSDDLTQYSREIDDNGNPTEDIADKETFHRLDALRYIVSRLKPASGGKQTPPIRGGEHPAHWASQF